MMVTGVKKSPARSEPAVRVSRSVGETARIASGLARRLRGGDAVLVSGPVGAGKTVFIRALARALGVGRPVRSPSFMVLAVYPVRRDRIRLFVHIDCYRLRRRAELAAIGLYEYLGSSQAVVAVEWPEKCRGAWVGRRAVQVMIRPISKTSRRLLVRFYADRSG